MFLKHRFRATAAALILMAQANLAPAADATLSPQPPSSETPPAEVAADAAGNRNTCQPLTNITLNIGVPNLTPGLTFRGGLLYLQPGADNLGYAVLTNEKNLASSVPLAQPFWGIQTLTPGFQPGFEVGAGFAFASSGIDVQINWQHLRTSTSNSVFASQESGQWVSPFSQTGPSTAQTFNDLMTSQGVNKLRSAEGQVKFAYDAVNLDFGQNLTIGSSLGLRLFAGLSYARLQEQLVSSFFGLPPDPNAPLPLSVPLSLSLNNTSTYTGAGPRFGFDGSYEIPRGFRLTGQLAGGLLIGQQQPAQYSFTATAPELAAVGILVNRESISSSAFAQLVYTCNAKIGMNYSHTFSSGSSVNLEAGYMAAIYTNPFSGYETNNNVLPLQIGSLSTASMRHIESNFTLNGLYLSAGYKW